MLYNVVQLLDIFVGYSVMFILFFKSFLGVLLHMWCVYGVYTCVCGVYLVWYECV